MKNYFFAAITILFLFGNIKSQTIISGGQVSGTWTKVNSPYIVQNAIMVPDDSTLTIQPGVSVEFQGSYKFWVLGRLIAIGTLADTIIFTANDTTTGWLGIRYENTTSTDTSVFQYCKFSYGKASNSTYYTGGAINFWSTSKAILTNSRFTRCYSSVQGGAVVCGDKVNIKYCLFDNNSSNACGAISCSGNSGTSEISNNLFIGNYSSGDYAGALGCWGKQIIHDNIFYKNVSMATSYSGGAIYCGSSSELNIYNNKFYNNSSPNFGGGAIYSFSSPIITNNVFSNNQSSKGGAIYCDGGTVNISNNTIMNNSSNYGGAIYCISSANPIIVNNILWGNTATISGTEIFLKDEYSDPNIIYCNILGGMSSIGLENNIFYTGNFSNNVYSDPMVSNPSNGSGLTFNGMQTDLSLLNGSPCINSGNPSGMYPNYDIAGNPRVYNNGIIDIGAYEFQGYSDIADNKFYNDYSLYPNPTRGIFFVRSNIPDMQTFDLQDIYGKIIISKSFTSSVEIDATSIPNGVYTLSLKSNSNIINKKLFIVH